MPAKGYSDYSLRSPKAMNKKISFAGPWITQKEIDYVIDATKNGWYETYDMHIKKLEKTVADYLGVKYALATHCCTLALHLATATLGLKAGDEVICTDFSWVATAYTIFYTGATPVFVDIDPDSWCIDPKAIKKAITDKTKAVMLVHCFGHPAQMDEIMEIAKQYRLYVIEDAAPALGSEFKGKKVGTFGDFGCFSFQGAKLTVSGEGGIMVTNNKELYEKARLLASMGRTDSKAVFWSDMLGYQYTIANLTAALALAQVERIDELIAKKRQIFSWYYERLKDITGIKIIKEKKDCKSNYCYPSILLEDSISVSRDEVLDRLKKFNIHCRSGFPRMSLFPVFEQRFPNPEAEKAEKRGISLASAANLTEEDINFVCDSLIKILRGS
jgi:perosamine synthetase